MHALQLEAHIPHMRESLWDNELQNPCVGVLTIYGRGVSASAIVVPGVWYSSVVTQTWCVLVFLVDLGFGVDGYGLVSALL